MLAAIEAAEARRKAIAEQCAEPGFFQRTSKEDAEKLRREDTELSDRLRAWLSEWEELEKELAAG